MPRQRQAQAAWTRTAIGDLLKKVGRPVAVEGSRTYREIGIRSHCKGIFHKPPIQGRELGSKRVFWVEPGCLVFNIIFAWEQAVALTTESERGMIASHRFPMYRSTNGKLLPEYAYLHFSSPRGKYDLGIASPGGAGRNKTLGQDEFRRLELNLPPIEVQRRIVQVACTWTRALAQVSTLILAKRKLKQGLAQQLLTGKRRFPGFKTRWSKETIRGVSRSIGSGGTPATSRPEYWSGTIPWITGSDFSDTGISRPRKFITKQAVDASSTRLCAKDTLLIVSRVGVGKVALAPFELAISQDITAVELNKEIVDPEFLRHELSSSSTGLLRFNQGTSINGISRGDLIQHRVQFPSLPEQRRIARTITAIEAEIGSLIALRNRLESQKRALMRNLLSGITSFKRPP